MRRWIGLGLLAVFLSACGGVDKLLEGSVAPDARLSVALQSTVVSVAQGGEQSLTATVTCVGDCPGKAAQTSVDGLPDGVTASVASTSTVGHVTTFTVTLRVAAGTKLGSYNLQVRGHVDPLTDATGLLVLNVTEAPSFSMTASKSSLTIAAGGVGRFFVQLARRSTTAAVTLSLQAPAGITATLSANPVLLDSATVTVTVAASVTAGSYTATLKGVATGVPDQTMPLTIAVSTDPLQIALGGDIKTSPASTFASEVSINRIGFTGAVTLTAENLPAGTTATFQPNATTAASAVMTLVVGPTISGNYIVTLRAKGVGVPDATTSFTLTVTPASIALTLNPQSVRVLQGTSVTSAVAIARTGFDGVVTVSAEGVPSGVTVSSSPANVTGTTATLTVTVSSTAIDGDYPVVIRATPVGLSPTMAQTQVFTVTVKSAPTGNGNVLLDWSLCAAPEWLASQDGTGPWTQSLPVAGVFRLTMDSTRGGIAYAEGGTTVTVRYMLKTEFTEKPFDMCPPPPATKSVTGTAFHTFNTEVFNYRLGGGSGTSTGINVNFSVVGIRDGIHDLVGWGQSSSNGLRGLLRRDVDIANGGSLGLVNLVNGAESFTALQRTLVIGAGNGEALASTMNYLTTSACTANLLSTATAATTTTINGVPEGVQRNDDFHMLTVAATSAGRYRSVTSVFHTMANRNETLPAAAAGTVTNVTGANYKRLRTTATLPSQYNTSISLRYNDGRKAMSVTASAAFVGSVSAILAMPDFTGAGGWPSAYAIAADSPVSWVLSMDGASGPGSLCTEGRRTFLATLSGVQ